MELDIIYKIAGIGMIVAVLQVLIKKTNNEEYSLMITLAGLVLVLVMMVKEIANLFDVIKTMFKL